MKLIIDDRWLNTGGKSVGSISQRTTRVRTAWLLLIVLGLLGVLSGRLFYLQVIKSGKLLKDAEDQRLREVPIEAKRGWILDRNKRPLALSYDADCIYAQPPQVKDPKATAEKLAPVLGMDREKLEKLLAKKTAFVWIKRKATEEEAQKVRQVALPGVEVVQKAQRFYPHGDLAAHVLGISGIDNRGLEGLELQYDSCLRGVPGSEQAEFDSRGLPIPMGEKRYIPPQDGMTLVLTIDEYIQHIAERELERAVRENGALRGCLVLMDPMNGEILAMANYPKFDPNHYNQFPVGHRKNWAVTDTYEPGSTFKVVTAAASLEEGIVDKDTRFHDPGFILVDDRRLRCWRPGGHGDQTFVEATENSCNPVFAKLALRLGKDTLYKYIRAFGFGETTGVDFPGEAKGILQASERIKNVELATTGFGQGISVTPIQLVTAFSAIANGGYLLEPHLVKEIRDNQGRVVKAFGRKVKRQVISEQTAKELTLILRSVVENGSGNRADVQGYRVAGKTGTAQKASQGNYGQGRIASFIGFAPADKPRIAGLIVLDEPTGSSRYGGVIAAPAFGEVVRDVLRYLGEPPKFELESGETQVPEALQEAPNLLHLSREEASKRLKQAGLVPRLIGEGPTVVDQQPRGGALLAPGTTVLLYFDQNAKYNNYRDSLLVVPDVIGLTPEQVRKVLTGLELELVPEGEGRAVGQEPKAGSKVAPGTRVRVRFARAAGEDG